MKEKTKILIPLALSGLISGFAVAFSKYVGFLIWVSMIPLFFGLKRLTDRENLKLRHVYGYGIVYFECFYAVCFHFFLYMYPLDFTGINEFYSVIVILIACLGLSLLQALFGGLAFVVYAATARGAMVKRFPIVSVLSFTAIYAFYEFTQTLGWWGVPWGRISLALTDMIIPIQTASLFGSYFITAVIVLTNALLAFALMANEDASRSKKYALSALLVFSLNIVLGAALYGAHKARANDGEEIKIAVIQGNYESTDKWFESPDMIVEKHLKLSAKAVREGAEIVLWAETALPFTLYEDDYYAYEISYAADILDATIIVGAMSDIDGESLNTLFCFNPDGEVSETKYYKRHLVPFGEYVPMRSFMEKTLPFLAEISMLTEDMIPGTDPSLFNIDGTLLGSLICFDSIYENLTRDTVNEGANLLLLSTNDSWFSDSAAIYMHNNQARFRAVEFGRYIARSANTGLSSFISNTGAVLDVLPPLTEDYLCENLTVLDSQTLYSKIGNVFVYLCGAFALVPFAYGAFCKLKAKKGLQNGDEYED